MWKVSVALKNKEITPEFIQELSNKFGLNISDYNMDEILKGYKIELEHGTKLGLDTNITNNDPIETLRIVVAHLKEREDYYSLLKKYVEK